MTYLLCRGGIRALAGLSLALMALLTCARLPAAETTAPVLDLARVQDQTLDNGLRVVLKSEPYWRAAALTLVLRSGSQDDPAGQEGVAHLVEHLLFEPTSPGQSLALQVEDMGGYVSATTTTDFTRLTVAVASQFVPELLPRLAAMVFSAQIASGGVELEKRVILQEMADRYTTVSGRLEPRLWGLAFTAHPYRNPIPGTAESVTGLTAAQAQSFYAQHYVPGNAALIAVGDLDPTTFFALAGEHFGPVPAQPRAAENLPVEPEQTEPRTAVDTLPLRNTILEFAWHAPGISEPTELCAMDLIYTALARGETRLLSRVLEDKELALASESSFLTQKYPGLLTLTAVVPPDKEVEARQAVVGLMALLRDDQFPPEQLDYLKKLLFADYAFANQSYTDQAETLAFYEALGGYRFACDYLERINQVTPEQLQATARRYLQDNDQSLVILRAEPAGGPGAEA